MWQALRPKLSEFRVRRATDRQVGGACHARPSSCEFLKTLFGRSVGIRTPEMSDRRNASHRVHGSLSFHKVTLSNPQRYPGGAHVCGLCSHLTETQHGPLGAVSTQGRRSKGTDNGTSDMGLKSGYERWIGPGLKPTRPAPTNSWHSLTLSPHGQRVGSPYLLREDR